MKNARKKGMRNELKAKKLLESDGWLVYKVKGATMFNKEVDIFGLFDIMGTKGNKYIFVQVKSNRVDKSVKEAITAFVEEHWNEYTRFEVWCFKDYARQPWITPIFKKE